MKVLVCGSRYFNDYDRLKAVLSNIPHISEIIHGGANGADLLGERYARQNSIPIRRFPAEWSKFGKSAGPIRNRQMLRHGAPDLVVAFLAPNSRGTQNMIDQATKAGIPVTIIDILDKALDEAKEEAYAKSVIASFLPRKPTGELFEYTRYPTSGLPLETHHEPS